MSLLLSLLGAALPAFAEAPAADPEALRQAAQTELQRALTLRLPDQPAPYLATFEVIDGQVVTAEARLGSLLSLDHGPYRTLRADVRVGSYQLDNTNFDVSFGEREGVVGRGLPIEDVEVALRRELWLAADQSYKGATEQYSARLSARKGRDGDKHPDSYLSAPPLRTAPLKVGTVDAAAMEARVLALTGALSAWPALEDGHAIGRDWTGVRFIASTDGSEAWLPTGFTALAVTASARTADGALLNNARWWVARDAAHLPSLDEMKAEVVEMATTLDASLKAPVEEDYLGPVLFEGPAATELFRQLLLDQLVGTPPAEAAPDPYNPSSAAPPPTARVGRRLLPDGWSVVDDAAAYPEAAGSYTHDFEGVPVERVELIEDGVVRDLLMSRIPRLDLQRSNGHGRALGTERRGALPAVVRVSPDRARSERALRKRALALARETGRPYVLVIRRLTPLALVEGTEFTWSGGEQLSGLTAPLEAYRLYPDGREELVRGLQFVGVDVRVLRDIAAAGRVGDPIDMMDAGPGPGRYQLGSVGGLPTTWMAPSVVITELELRGSGGREPRARSQPKP